MESTIIALIEVAAKQVVPWIREFRAWQSTKGTNGLTERNLTFQVARAFLAQVQDGMAFMEVPFSGDQNDLEHKRLDAYLFSSALALMVESKIFWQPSNVDEVAWDMGRMTPHLVKQLNSRHIGAVPPCTHGLVICESWNANKAAWWCGDDQALSDRWNRTPILKAQTNGAWKFGKIDVHTVDDSTQGKLYWLYGISPAITALERDGIQ